MASTAAGSLATAAVSWLENNSKVHLRIYSSDGHTVTERCWDDNG